MFFHRSENANDYLHMKYSNQYNNTSQICEKCILMHRNIRNPMFVIEYEYILHESTNVIIFVIIKNCYFIVLLIDSINLIHISVCRRTNVRTLVHHIY